MDQAKIGRFIAERRKKIGITQKELAEKLGIGDKAVSKWECGRGMPDNSIMLPLCSILGINVNELLMGEALSEKACNESTEEIILTLMEEKNKSKKNLFSCILSIVFLMVLFLMVFSPIRIWYSWVYFFDPLTLVMVILLVLIMLLITGNVKTFFSSFRLIFTKDADKDSLPFALQTVKLAIVSFLLGGGLFTLLDTIFLLHTMEQKTGNGVSIALLPISYGIFFALLLLPIKYKLALKIERTKMEETYEESNQS